MFQMTLTGYPNSPCSNSLAMQSWTVKSPDSVRGAMPLLGRMNYAETRNLTVCYHLLGVAGENSGPLFERRQDRNHLA